MTKRNLVMLAISLALTAPAAVQANAFGLPDTQSVSAFKTYLPAQGRLGTVNVNPYGNAPLAAVIKRMSLEPTDITVTVRGKGDKGVDISYPVGRTSLLTHDGIPVFGLYPNHLNLVDVEYSLNGERINETYKVLTGGIDLPVGEGQTEILPKVTAAKVAKGFEQRLYLLDYNHNNAYNERWRKSQGGQVWDSTPLKWISDTNGDVRWVMDPANFHSRTDGTYMGDMNGFHQTADGSFIVGKGQRVFKFDMLGKIQWNILLPQGYVDHSHDIDEMPNGNLLVRVAKEDYPLDNGRLVTTVRDIVIEMTPSGQVVEEWDMNKILDPFRDAMLIAMDQGAVCMNVNVDKAGEVMTKEELDKQPYGDIPGVGPGRNWLHINSVQYIAEDDSIIISPRHQATAIKIGRDKQVKWILGNSQGWQQPWASKLLTPVDAAGNKLDCNVKGECRGTDFDFSYTQHTAYYNPEIGSLSVFDNGDARHMTQPSLPFMKYSRAVEYQINEQDMTVQQTWQYGKERGYDWYSHVTSNVFYRPETDTYQIHSASAGLFDKTRLPIHYVNEVKRGSQEVMVELQVQSYRLHKVGYRASVVDQDKLFQ
ncbi:aryl-sulfate sulfotransferase [Ferrimonas senticii]|uniref:aryl-sulfate sulfotransferase n=1 Tax=Ferrimonas senticii TaxID=394566 RepID=UPI0004025398|nr:aryl-sulfate sulfotransferase [Ferrimonas senticii]